MRDLNTLCKKELEEFFNCFDLVLCDVDGVLWLLLESIPGTNDGINSLKNLGKKVVFVSNNSTKTIDVYHKQLTGAGFCLEKEDIITPVLAMVHYLKEIHFEKEIYVIGTSPIKKELQNGGFQIAEDGPDRAETLQDFVAKCIIDTKKIGAVIADGDINLNHIKLQRAACCLKNPEVIFITGASDRRLPVGLDHVLVGPGYFQKILEDFSGRKAYAMAKPSPHLNDYIVQRLKIGDRSRVLFIGDSISEDMGFANNAGYRKLLVLSGLTKKKALEEWDYPEEYKPDYYVNSLKDIHELIQRHFGNGL